MIVTLQNWDVYTGLAINGLFTGLGAAVGTYLSQTHIIKNAEKVRRKIRKAIRKKK